jgi:RNA-binding protein 8A
VRASHLRNDIDSIVNATFSYFSPQGRGFENADIIDDEVKHSRNDRYETLRDGDGERGGQRGQPQKSIEGWVVLVTGVHEEAQEEDIHENFGDFGEISNLHLNLDRRTGFVKGYCLIEYKEKEEAQSAIENMDGKLMLDEEVRVDWAFVNAPEKPSSRRDRR